MKTLTLLSGLSLFAMSPVGYSAVTFSTNLSVFNRMTSTSIVEDFESFSDAARPSSSNGISYSSPINLWVASPGYTNFGVPITTSSILTANGDEDYTLGFSMPITALGFDTYLNGLGSATVSVFGNSGLLGTFSLIHNPKLVGFLGIASTENITSLHWLTTGGYVINTGIDNIRTGSVSAVPVPAAIWLFGSGLMGLLGLNKRSRYQSTWPAS